MYNEEIGKLLYLITKYPKDILVTGHSANVETESGVEERRVAVKGELRCLYKIALIAGTSC